MPVWAWILTVLGSIGFLTLLTLWVVVIVTAIRATNDIRSTVKDVWEDR